MSEVDVKFGYEPPSHPWTLIKELALVCEKVGFDSFWVPDHLVGFGVRDWSALDAWSMIAGLAQVTNRIMLGSGVSDVHRRHPAQLLQTAITCHMMSGGRTFLGIGVGEAMNILPFGIPYDRPLSRTWEALKIIRLLLEKDRVSFEGKYYKLVDASIQPKPEGKLPIYVAGVAPRSLQMIGELADGWFPASLSPEEYKEKLKIVRDHAKRAGRDPEEIEPALLMFSVIERDYNTAINLAKIPVKVYLLSRPRLLEAIGIKPPTYEFEMTYKLVMNPETMKRYMEEIEKIPDEAVERCAALIGDPDTIIEKVEEYIKAGVKHIVVNFFVSPARLRETCEYFANTVIRYFKG